MPSRQIKTFDGKYWPLGRDMDELTAFISSRREQILEELELKRQQNGPDIVPRVCVLYLGTDQRGLVPAALKSGRSVYIREDLQPEYQPYWDALVSLGWQPEVRYMAFGYNQAGLHIYVIGEPGG